MSLSEIVNVSIDSTTRTPTRAGFGTPLIAAYHTYYADLVRAYNDPSDMLADGFVATDPAYLAAVALKSQSPSVAQFKVGRRQTAFAQKFTLTPLNTTEGFVYGFTIAGVSISHVNGAAETPTTIASSMASAITLIVGLTATASFGVVTVSVDDPGVIVDVVDPLSASTPMFSAANLLFEDITVDPGIVADMAAIRAADSDWYGLVLDLGGKETWTALAAWAEAETVLAFADTMDTDVVIDTSGNLVAVLELAGYARTVACFNRSRLLSWFGARWLGEQLPRDPGTSTWGFKRLAGLTGDKLTTTERNALRNLATSVGSGNYYIRLGGLDVTLEGVSGSGEFIDITRGIDLIAARMQEGIFGLLASASKIPYEDSGVDRIRSEMLGVLGRVTSTPVRPNILAADPAPTVTAPLVATVATADKNNRILPDMVFQGTLSGAIHKIVVRGTLSI